MTPAELRDRLQRQVQNPRPTAKVLAPWVKGQRQVVGFHFDEDGNLILEVEGK